MSIIQPLIITFNCARELIKPMKFAAHLVQAFPDASPEIVGFALEELAPIGYSFLGGRFLEPYQQRIQATMRLTARVWGGNEYLLGCMRNVGMTMLMIFYRADVSSLITNTAVGGTGVGWQETGNKGGVAISLGYLNEQKKVIWLTFVAAHLAPMEANLERRNEDWRQIVQRLVLTESQHILAETGSGGEGEHERLLGHDHAQRAPTSIYATVAADYADESQPVASHLIVAGDLNYRTSNTPPRPSSKAMFPRLSVDGGSPQHHKHLLLSDQLSIERAAQKTLHGLTEAPINFPPTYKYSNMARSAAKMLEEGNFEASADGDEAADLGDSSALSTLDWPWSPHRWPSWCDRILWLPLPSSSEAQIKPCHYTSLPLMSTSDHQPVVLELSIPLAPVRTTPGDLREKPPFSIDQAWRERRVMARRKEVVIGMTAYVALTWEGRTILLALILGATGGWALMRSLLGA